MAAKKEREIKRTTCKPSLIYQMIVDAIAVYAVAFFANCIEYIHIEKDFALVLQETSRIDKTALYNAGFDAVNMTIGVVALIFIAVHMYWSRQSVLQTISDFRWKLIQKRKKINVKRPDCTVNGGDGWFIEKLKGKDVYLIACFAYDGTLTMVDRKKGEVAFRSGVCIE